MKDDASRDWDRWGPLAARYRPERPRRILALDGGGIRGLITLEVLRRLETELATATGAGETFRLCDFFDLVGGTSTGAIIAAGLARGMSVEEISKFYQAFGRKVFVRRKPWELWQSLYGDGPLALTLKDKFGANTNLEPQNLKCLLVVVTRNTTTDSAWPVSSNPFAKYNDPHRADCNLRIPLWKLVRASTAAPVYFPPEVVSLDPDNPNKTFVFVDGGTTPYNNPAFLLFRMATAPAYRLEWKTGERRLLIVSVGTGSAPVPGSTPQDPDVNLASAALNTLSALMSQASVDQDVNCRVIGRCTYGGVIDRELRDLLPVEPGLSELAVPLDRDMGRAFLYVRYDADLTPEGLKQLGLARINARRVQKMDAAGNMADLQAIGKALASKVDLSDLAGFVKTVKA